MTRFKHSPCGVLVTCALTAISTSAAGESAAVVEDLVIRGNHRTRESTIRSLLPGPLPRKFDEDDVEELERRLRNLEIFDDVSVKRSGAKLDVVVREKFTITPSFELSTGSTAADTFVSAGATEYNFLGTASSLGLETSYDQRRPNAAVWFEEHAFRSDRPALLAGAFFASASMDFEGPRSASWFRDQVGGWVGVRLPFSYDVPLRFEVGGWGYREWVSDFSGAGRARADGVSMQSSLKITWDEYAWDDLVPRGFRITTEGAPGVFLPDAGASPLTPRHEANVEGLFAIPASSWFVFTGRARGNAYATGNANHSGYLGSIEGVRGLEDGRYRTHVQSFANLETRFGWRFARRWAVQFVLFGDGAVFRSVDAEGRARPHDGALSFGTGIRVIPTALTKLLLRIDGARLVEPDPRWFVQLGVRQYF